MWITNTTPAVTEAEPYDHRSESAVVLIQTRSGQHYTARWVVYVEADFGSMWELCGREGLQLEPAEVVAWQAIVPFVAEG